MTAFHRIGPHLSGRVASPDVGPQPGLKVVARRLIVAAIVAVTTGVAAAPAQQSAPAPKRQPSQAAAPSGPSGPPNALQGFSQNRDQPVNIKADELTVHDKDKRAVFSGDVHLVQGDTDMRTARLVVFYDDSPPPADPAAASGKNANASAQITPQQNQQIKRVEAKGNVIVVKKQKDQKDQTATGNEGIFDMRANTVTMLGNVHISQGDSFLVGDNLTVNMTTGDAVLTAKPVASVKDTTTGKDGGKDAKGRVQGIFNPSTMKQDGVGMPAGSAKH